MGRFLGGIEWGPSTAARDAVLQRFVDSRPPEREDDEADIRWGAKSTWQFQDEGEFQSNRVTIVRNFPDRPEDEEELEAKEVVVDFAEVPELRQETEVRVENPDDSEQYVIVKNVDVIVFEGPDLRPQDLIGEEGRQDRVYYRYTLTTPEE